MRSHSNAARPGKRYIVTNQARPVPSTATPSPTPAIKISVFHMSSVSCVSQRCFQTSRLGVAMDETTINIGVATRSATAPAASGQGSRGRQGLGCRRPNATDFTSLVAMPRMSPVLLVTCSVAQLDRGHLQGAGRSDVHRIRFELPPVEEQGIRLDCWVGGILVVGVGVQVLRLG